MNAELSVFCVTFCLGFGGIYASFPIVSALSLPDKNVVCIIVVELQINEKYAKEFRRAEIF